MDWGQTGLWIWQHPWIALSIVLSSSIALWVSGKAIALGLERSALLILQSPWWLLRWLGVTLWRWWRGPRAPQPSPQALLTPSEDLAKTKDLGPLLLRLEQLERQQQEILNLLRSLESRRP